MVALSESIMKNRVKLPPGKEITMTSYPACNKTSLSRKPCIPDKNVTMERYQKVMVAFSKSVMKSACSTPWQTTDDDVTSGWQ